VLIGSIEATLLLLLVVVVFGPIVAERFRIPAIIGLIFGGVLFGPFMLGWMLPAGLVTQLGAIGILYLMFLAGLGFDLRAFLANRNNAIVYGLLSFVIPFALSFFVSISFLEVGALGAALIGGMWASNTLVAYPDVRSAGLQNNRAVSAAVSAGVVADLLSLTVLALVTSTAVIETDTQPEAAPSVQEPTLSLWIALPVLIAFTIWLLPKVAEWFFVSVGRSRMQRFTFALAGMAAGATVALLGGIEGLIGAFLAGLGMNRLVPSHGALMERLDFVGSAIFVPAFIVSIGLNIDPAVLFDTETLLIGLVFTGFVVVGKTTSAMITGAIFHLSRDEVGLMSTLSFGQAASTLAIAQVGLELGMFDQQIVNAAVLAIVATALITSYGTRFYIRRVPRPEAPRIPPGQSVLVDVRPNGSDLDALMDFAAGIAKPDGGLVHTYAVSDPDAAAATRETVAAAVAAAAARGLDADGVTRIDESFRTGTLNLIAERETSLLLLAWRGPSFPVDYLMGNDLDAVGERCPVPAAAVRVLRPWSRIVVATGRLDRDWYREDASLALALVRRLRRYDDMPLTVLTPDAAFAETRVGDPDGVEIRTDLRGRVDAVLGLGPDDLAVITAHVIQGAPPMTMWRAARNLHDANLAVVAGPYRLSIARRGASTQDTTPQPVG
jgi:Kef-type K+ transport system membrane component KefB